MAAAGDAPMVLDLSNLPIEVRQEIARQFDEAHARNAEQVEAAAKAKKEKEIRLGEEIKSLELIQCELRKMIELAVETNCANEVCDGDYLSKIGSGAMNLKGISGDYAILNLMDEAIHEYRKSLKKSLVSRTTVKYLNSKLDEAVKSEKDLLAELDASIKAGIAPVMPPAAIAPAMPPAGNVPVMHPAGIAPAMPPAVIAPVIHPAGNMAAMPPAGKALPALNC
jgi:hypothetical protein